MNNSISRKEAISKLALTPFAVSFGNYLGDKELEDLSKIMKEGLKGNLKHSVCRWCYPNIPLEQLCEASKEIGIQSIELLNPQEWIVVKKYGLTCAMANSSPLHITKGFNNPIYHEQLKKDYLGLLSKANDFGIEKIICFSGNRDYVSREGGLENCLKGLDEIIQEASKLGITICMELLNSKIDHIDYQCDKTAWGVELVNRLGNDHFKLLYDIYHMQIMEGDVIRTIQTYSDYFAHYHTGGVPGRHEIGETQELNYSAIMKAIVETGYDGFIGQEFIPSSEKPLESLKEGVRICDV
ncbi:MAG: TIM barrel protein [Bacteroidota bacterium]